MPRAWFWCVTSLLVFTASAEAATVLEKVVEVEISPSGKVREHHRLAVELESLADVEAWSTYAIYLDENREIKDFSAHVRRGDGERIKVRRKQIDTVEAAGGGTFHGSQYFRVVSFPGAAPGSRIAVQYEVVAEPYYPSGQLELAASDPIASLRVVIRDQTGRLRWRIDGSQEGLEVVEENGEVVITAQNLELSALPELAIEPARPVLRWAWDGEGNWESVGRWYAELSSEVPLGDEAVRHEARRLVEGVDDPRQRLEALLAFAREKVRYVAVEVGIGGYRPSSPVEVLDRRWGDCKDKSFLLIDLLHEVGIEAHPVLIRADPDHRLDLAFPSPLQFNHLIVAVPEGEVAFGLGDPVAGGYLFLDPTQTRGSASWLHPADQGQDVLVVRGGVGEIVRTPIAAGHELRELIVNLEINSEGAATGDAGLRLRGAVAASLLGILQSAPLERSEELVRSIFGRFLPGVEIRQTGWKGGDAGIPELAMAASVEVEGLVQGLGRLPNLRLPGLGAMPEPSALDGHEGEAVVGPGVAQSTWQLTLPEGWCPPRAEDVAIENELGTFRQSLQKLSERSYLLERRAELNRRQIGEGELESLAELAKAEERASRRRLRLECEEVPQSAD